MKDFLLTKGLRFVGYKMDGKKTYAGAVGKILSGLSSLFAGIVGFIGIAFPDQGLPQMEVSTAWTTVLAGIALISSGLQGIGIGHKLEKQRKAVEVPKG